jgi:hypothetical protein
MIFTMDQADFAETQPTSTMAAVGARVTGGGPMPLRDGLGFQLSGVLY